jgi:hypothetical protein
LAGHYAGRPCAKSVKKRGRWNQATAPAETDTPHGAPSLSPPADMIDMHDQAAIPRRQSLSRTTMRLQPAAGPHHRTRIALRPAHHVLLALSPTSAGARPHTYAGGLPGPRACPANRRLGLSCDCELRALAVTLYLFSACSSLFGSTRVFPAYCT